MPAHGIPYAGEDLRLRLRGHVVHGDVPESV